MRYILFVLALSLLNGCVSARDPIEFCSFTAQDIDQGTLLLNTDEQTLRREGALFEYKIVESDIARGFVSPFPLTLPKHHVSSTASAEESVTAKWELGGYVFRMTTFPSDNSDWMLIQAQPIAGNDGRETQSIEWRSSVLYSPSRGALAVRAFSTFREDKVTSEAYFCGSGALHAATF